MRKIGFIFNRFYLKSLDMQLLILLQMEFLQKDLKVCRRCSSCCCRLFNAKNVSFKKSLYNASNMVARSIQTKNTCVVK
jgi:hypothetical protein